MKALITFLLLSYSTLSYAQVQLPKCIDKKVKDIVVHKLIMSMITRFDYKLDTTYNAYKLIDITTMESKPGSCSCKGDIAAPELNKFFKLMYEAELSEDGVLWVYIDSVE